MNNNNNNKELYLKSFIIKGCMILQNYDDVNNSIFYLHIEQIRDY